MSRPRSVPHRPNGPTLVPRSRSIPDASEQIARARQRLQQAQTGQLPRVHMDPTPSVNAATVDATIRDRRHASQMAAAQRRVADAQPKTHAEQLIVNQEELLRRMSAMESMLSNMSGMLDRFEELLFGEEESAQGADPDQTPDDDGDESSVDDGEAPADAPELEGDPGSSDR